MLRSVLRTLSMVYWPSNNRMNGPMAQLALLSLALPKSRALRPSKSRKLTSLPMAAPTTWPLELMTKTISGSGLFQELPGCKPTSKPEPTALMACDLVKISASGPIPTSRYCDQTPCATKTSLSLMACAEPGLTLRRLSPMTSVTALRTLSALAASPRACSSMTRSSILATKVTPAALMACKSVGARNHACFSSRFCGSVLAHKDSVDQVLPWCCMTRAATLSISIKSLLVWAKPDKSVVCVALTLTR